MSEERADTKELILAAAEALLARLGYRKMTMEDIALEAGISRRTVYLHFAGKEDVAIAVNDRRIDQLVAYLKSIAESDGAPEERISAMLIGRILWMFDRAQSAYHAFDEMYAAIRPRYMPRRESYMLAEANVIAKVLREGRDEGRLAFGDPLETAHALVLATNSLAPFSLSVRQLGDRAEMERKVGLIAGLLLDGLRSR